MGICASKCFPSPTPSMSDPESPRPHDIDKLVLSSLTLTSPPPPKNPFSDNTKNFSKFQIHPSPSSSSSSSSNPSATMITSASNATSTSYSYSSPYSVNNSSSKFQPSMKKTFSDEYLLSYAKENPTKITNEKEKLLTSSVIMPSSQNRLITKGLTSSSSSSNLRQRTNSNISSSIKVDESIQAKRARSVSPASRTGRKVIRSETGPVKPIYSLNTNTTTKQRTGTPPLPQRRHISSQKGTVNVIKRDVKVSSTMEKDSDILLQLSEDSKMGEFEEEQEVISTERVRTPPADLVEDLNNPLIAMDCFIFL